MLIRSKSYYCCYCQNCSCWSWFCCRNRPMGRRICLVIVTSIPSNYPTQVSMVSKEESLEVTPIYCYLPPDNITDKQLVRAANIGGGLSLNAFCNSLTHWPLVNLIDTVINLIIIYVLLFLCEVFYWCETVLKKLLKWIWTDSFCKIPYSCWTLLRKYSIFGKRL